VTDVIKNKALPFDVVEMSRVIHQTLVRCYNDVTVVLKWPVLHKTSQTKPIYEGSMPPIRHILPNPLQLKVVSTQHGIYQMVVDLLYLKMISNINVTIF